MTFKRPTFLSLVSKSKLSLKKHLLYEIFNLIFGQKQRAITPGQATVIYESNVCLGGGVIKEAINNE